MTDRQSLIHRASARLGEIEMSVNDGARQAKANHTSNAKGANVSATTKTSDSTVLPVDLRDYFAGEAMQGIVSSIDSEDNYQRLRGHAMQAGLTVSEWIARDAYKQADAMLRARGAQ